MRTLHSRSRRIRKDDYSTSNQVGTSDRAHLESLLNVPRLLLGSGFSDEERMESRPIVYSNTIQSLAAVIKAMGALQIPLGNAERAVRRGKGFTIVGHGTPPEAPIEFLISQ